MTWNTKILLKIWYLNKGLFTELKLIEPNFNKTQKLTKCFLENSVCLIEYNVCYPERNYEK